MMTDRHVSPAHLLVMFVMVFCFQSCGAPAEEPEATVPEATEALADTDTDADEDQDEDEPRSLRVNTSQASPGYVYFNPNLSLTTYLVDVEGRVVHMWQSSQGPAGGAYLLDNGHLLRGMREPDVPVFSGGGQGGRLQELTWDGEVVWDFTFATEDHLLHHDVAVLPNGNILGIAWEQKTAADANQAGRLPTLTPEAGVWPDMIVEFEPQPPDGARIVWQWHMWDHTIQNHDPDADNYGEPTEHPELIDINGDRDAPEMSAEELARLQALGYVPEDTAPEDLQSDFMHMNAVNYNAALDQIVMSVPRFNEIWVIDHSTTTVEAAGHTGGRGGAGWGSPLPVGQSTCLRAGRGRRAAAVLSARRAVGSRGHAGRGAPHAVQQPHRRSRR